MMKNNILFKKGLACVILVLMLLIPSALAVNVKNGKEILSINQDDKILGGSITKVNKNLFNSPWPMYCHDVRHTGRSEYSTANNPFEEKWWFKTTHENDYYFPDYCFVDIAGDGTIYLIDAEGWIYAIYPNGTLKWESNCNKGGEIGCHPAIGIDGAIYIGTYYGHFYAVNPDGSLKWRYVFPSGVGIFSSPAIGDDGTIYFGTEGEGCVYAFYPNSTIKWRYQLVCGSIYSSPAIATDGTIYIGDDAGYFYAVHQNGTLYWKVKLQEKACVPHSPSIGDDGTIYIATEGIEVPSYLYAIDPTDGSEKWNYKIGTDFYVNPSLGEDGTIYVICSGKLYAINPDGTEKWTHELGSSYIVRYSEPAISADGTVYVAAGANTEDDENYLYAFNPDGSIRWSKEFDIPYLTVESSPVIGADGTIYLGLSHFREVVPFWNYDDTLYLHAFNERDTNAPSAPVINGPTEGKSGKCYNYTIASTDPSWDDIYYSVSWGEPSYQIQMGPWIPSVFEEFGPFPSGEEITINHNWTNVGSYTIKVIARNTNNLVSPWSTLEVSVPKNNNQQIRLQFSNSLLFQILQKMLNVR